MSSYIYYFLRTHFVIEMKQCYTVMNIMDLFSGLKLLKIKPKENILIMSICKIKIWNYMQTYTFILKF